MNTNHSQKPSLLQHALTIFCIIAVTLIIFAPALQGHFLNWDDPSYITDNSLIQDISPENILKTFSTYILGNYQPLTIFTFSIEYHFFKLNPFPYHLTNLIFHLLNIVLVYILIFRLSRKYLVAILVGLFFALHPTRVESVAWITERKDVLFAFFYLLGLIQYLQFLDSGRKIRKYVFYTTLCFLLSLLSKPSAMSFPLILLLVDYIKSRTITYKNILRKIPHLFISLLFGIIAIFGTFTPTNQAYPIGETIVQTLNHTITPLDQVKASEELFPLSARLIITCRALTTYFTKTVWIDHLSPYYPLPLKRNNRFTNDYYTAITMIVLLALILSLWKNTTLRFSILFFITTIFFNLPLSRVGSVETADRFTYIPYIGLFYLLALLFEKIHQSLKSYQPKLAIVSFTIPAILLISFAINTRTYAYTWKDSYQLWTNVIKNYPNNTKGYFNRGNYFFEEERYEEALTDYKRALKIKPRNPKILYNIGNCFLRLGYLRWAFETYNQALKINPDYELAQQRKLLLKNLLVPRVILNDAPENDNEF